MAMSDIANDVAIVLVVEDEPLLRLAGIDLVEAAAIRR